ncbi:AT-hook motif nuclear-localized protein 28-like [Canna indica]|uniref:AT-hook motif nuclear-localized protein n=1 Tax=Canna indica TaxID=4628 RepID=A0AAQ3JWS7_9LILI|nr:AT-hook motif nuclear-localized protein 28-like [Canna indica]
MKDKPFPLHYLQHHQLQQQQKSLSDEVDSSRSSGENKRPKHDEPKERTPGDGSTIEVAKRPRGRPPGSKNKPKLPVVITREAEPSATMRPHVLEIPSGHDVVDSLVRFSRRRNLGVCVISGTGSVANVTLRQPNIGGFSPPPAGAPATIMFRGRFEILALSATFFPPAMAALSPAAAAGGLSISLAGPQGQVVGGTVAGPLVAADTVVVVAAAFSNPTFHRLPVEDDVSVSVSVSGSGDMEEHEQHMYQQQQQQQQDHHQRRHQGPTTTVSASTAVASSSMTIYGGHGPSDVLWAPTARPPQPPPF